MKQERFRGNREGLGKTEKGQVKQERARGNKEDLDKTGKA